MGVFHAVAIVAVGAAGRIDGASSLQSEGGGIASEDTSPDVVVLGEVGVGAGCGAESVASLVSERARRAGVHTEVEAIVGVPELRGVGGALLHADTCP